MDSENRLKFEQQFKAMQDRSTEEHGKSEAKKPLIKAAVIELQSELAIQYKNPNYRLTRKQIANCLFKKGLLKGNQANDIKNFLSQHFNCSLTDFLKFL